jgi:hypothetical protein
MMMGVFLAVVLVINIAAQYGLRKRGGYCAPVLGTIISSVIVLIAIWAITMVARAVPPNNGWELIGAVTLSVVAIAVNLCAGLVAMFLKLLKQLRK